MAMIEKVRISWSEIETLAEACAAILEYKLYKPNRKFINIYAIPRGGLIPAVLVSHKMERLRSYVHLLDFGYIPKLENAVILDDIYDTGATLDPLIQISPDTVFCTLTHKKENGHILFQGKFVKPEKWLVFPWERHHEIPNS